MGVDNLNLNALVPSDIGSVKQKIKAESVNSRPDRILDIQTQFQIF